MTISDEERRAAAGWAADCAERALPRFEAAAPADPRPRAAIAAARTFATGGRRTRPLQAAALGAHAAAREVGDPAASAAARAAGFAAATAFTHDEDTIGTIGHILGSAVYAARARSLAAGDDPTAADEELDWAIEHVPPTVCALVRRVPRAAARPRSLEPLQARLDAALRG